ncbi:hypothetical protein BTVI_27342 [Pitangus sulphuratus]|nr:hypothetical protein BTVI_27342 [Pitangus sulphuratus]
MKAPGRGDKQENSSETVTLPKQPGEDGTADKRESAGDFGVTSRALADILRQQGPIPIGHCERETISAIDTSPKENTPVRTSSKNHYTPVRTSKSNPGILKIQSQ